MDEKLGTTGDFPEGKLTEEDKGGLRLAVGTHRGKVIIDFGEQPIAWFSMNTNDARKFALFIIGRANEADSEPFIRADGGVICPECGDTYRHHPHDMRQLDNNGEPILRVRCDGKRLKL